MADGRIPRMEVDRSIFEELKQMSGADFIDELVDTYLEDAPKLVQEMKTALQAKDAQSFRRAAHSLKSNSATFGATNLSTLAKELETLGKEDKLDAAGELLPAAERALASVADELKGLRQ
jgi:HPt (histidine-containing phosphotransfer) domain-containing protein